MKDFITPLNHVNFLAKKIFDDKSQKIIDISIAHLQQDGGGPIEMHTHTHNHLFIVVKGEAKLLIEDSIVILSENESYLLKGTLSHSVWNNINDETIIIGITTEEI